MIWPFNIFQRETRSGAGPGSYTDAVVQAIIARSGGKTLSIPSASAAVEMATGVVCRAFQASELSGTTPAVEAALDAPCRGLIARSLMRFGEALFVIRVTNGRIQLIPGESSTVTGDPDPDSWEYEITCGGPSGTHTYKGLSPDQVLHIRYACDPGRTWGRGRTLAGRNACGEALREPVRRAGRRSGDGAGVCASDTPHGRARRNRYGTPVRPGESDGRLARCRKHGRGLAGRLREGSGMGRETLRGERPRRGCPAGRIRFEGDSFRVRVVPRALCGGGRDGGAGSMAASVTWLDPAIGAGRRNRTPAEA